MTSVTRRRLLAVATTVVLVVLLAVTMQVVLAAVQTFVTPAGATDGTWPYGSAFGTVGVAGDSYHMSVNHWNPESNGSISMQFDDATTPIGFDVTAWTDVPSGGSLDFSQSASVVFGSPGAWTWSPTNTDHAPAAYNNAFKGCHWGQCTHDSTDYGAQNAGAPFPIRARDVKSLNSTFRIGVNGDSNTGVWNAAFDIWLDTGNRTIRSGLVHPFNNLTPYEEFVGQPVLPGYPGALMQWTIGDQGGQNDGAEIMIWMNNRGYDNDPIVPGGTRLMNGNTPVTVNLAGGTWEIWVARIGTVYKWNVVSYVRTTRVNEMVNFDANQFVQDAMTRTCPANETTGDTQCVKPDWWVTSVPAGFEIWAKGAGLEVTEFSTAPNTDVQVDTGRTDTNGRPFIFWGQKFLLRYKPTCEATTVTYTIADNHPETADVTGSLVQVVPNVEGTVDMWAARAGPIYPNHDDATVTFTPNCGAPTTVSVYIDPSGVVVNTLGQPIENATVLLQYAPGVASTDPEPAAGAFADVPDGSDIMSPDNRDNPDLTNADGYYRWDVVDGWYKVQASKTGCTSAESPALPVSEGNPATNVNLVLDCGDGTGGDDLQVQVTPQSDWGTGYCSNVTVTNNTAAPVDWQVSFDVEGTIYDFWNVVWSQNGETVTAEGVDWNNVLQPGESTHSLGFCANRSGGGGGSTSDGVSVAVTTQNDWGTGYCANVVVTNNTAEPVDWKVTFDVVGTINNFWNVVWSQSGATATAEGIDYNNILQPGESTHSIGFCAAK